MIYDDVTKKIFLDRQLQLFPEPVAENLEDAEDFLCEMDARVFSKESELLDFMDRLGMDVSELSEGELAEQPEVFALPDGRFLYVEG